MLAVLLSEKMLVLFAVLALGSWLGQFSIRGVALGTAGVFFVALAFGNFGLTTPKEVMDLGLVLFVYAVGLQAGPRFFRTFRRQGIRFVVIGLATVTTGALVTVLLAYWQHLPSDLAVGLYTGAMTCTPALAAALDALSRVSSGPSAALSVGYGIAYPFSMIGVVVLAQVLPQLLKRDVRAEDTHWLDEQQREMPSLEARQFRITNPNCAGKTLFDIQLHRMSQVNISRILRNGRVEVATPTVALALGDVVMAVGPNAELDKVRLLLGEETHVPMDANVKLVSVDVEVTDTAIAGRTLAELRVWQRFGVVITRIRRQGMEIIPTGRNTLEMGDSLRVVGEREATDQFAKVLGSGGRKADETNMVPFLVGLVLGIALGTLPLPLPNGMQIKLGIAGGAFLVSLLIGHLGRIGPLRLYVPSAARNLSRELGLMLFLAGAGTSAGSSLLDVLQHQGLSLFFSGALITITSVLVGIVLMVRIYRMNIHAVTGALCACLTNPPGLAAANLNTQTDLPALAYASVYPVALIFKILFAQFLIDMLGLLK